MRALAEGDQFVVTQEALREAFNRLNAELFEGRLAAIPLELSGETKRGGTYRAKADWVQPNPRMRRLTRNFGIRNLRDESISISRKLCLSQDTLDRFMAHEMVHQWQSEVLGVSEDEGGHGDSFRRKMEEINAVKGSGFVTVTSDVVAGGIGGREGQVYHVVIFERGSHKFGGFSRRPLGEKEREIIERVVKGMGASYRVLTTTSHDAQVLLDLSRLKPGARRRSWPRIPDDIYESIVGSEVTASAALRGARLRLADLGGITLYHGTGLREAAAIARSGIRSFSGDRWSSNPGIANAGTDAIYLTPDFDLALRYAQGLAGDRTPAVLECRVSGRHMKKLRTDPMDTWEDSWEEHGWSDSLPQRAEALQGLHGDARGFLADAGVRDAYRMEWPDDSDDCDGLNLYRLALRLIRAGADPDVARETFRRFREKFPPGDHGYFHIREDGTIRLDSSYWEEAHQVQYAPRRRDTRSPTRLPPAAIKAAWIPARLAPAGAETRSAKPRKLPCESKAEFDEETKAAESVPDWCDRLEEAESAEDVRDIRVNGIDVDDITDDFPEPLLAVRELAMSIAESPSEDHAQRIEGLRDEWGEYEPYERWGEDTYGEPVEMAKVPLEALRPAPELVTAALRRAAATAALAGEGETVRYRGELWHGTTPGRAASIARAGFTAQPHGEMSCDAVSLSRNPRAAEIFAGGDGVVFQLDAALDRLLVLPDFVYDAMACYRGSGAGNEDRLVEDAARLKRLGVVRPEWPGDEPPEDSDWTGGMNEYDWLEKALPGYDGVIVPGFDSAQPNAEAEIAVFADAASRLKGMVTAVRIGREWYDAADGWEMLLKTEPEGIDDDWSDRLDDDDDGVEAALRAAALDVGASSGTITAYHATLSGSDILGGGFRKSDDVGRLGLGGGSLGGSVSFTTDWGVAKGIHRAFVMMHSLVNAADPLAAMREHLGSLDPGVAAAVLEYWKSADGGDLRELLNGWKPRPYGSRMQTHDQLVRQGFKPVHAAGDEGGEGSTLYHWLEPVTGKDAERMVYTYVKVYFYANPAEYNPVFMGGDSSHFKGIPRDDIGIFTVELSIDPSKKRKNHGDLHSEPGYAILPAESEYRVSDLSMISAILDYDPRPGDAPPIRGEERSYHEAPEVEAAVNALLGLLSRHHALLKRAGIDTRQAAAELRNADDMDAVARVAIAVLKASGLRGAAGTLRNIARLRSQIEPSGTAKAALDALPEPVREEAAAAPPTAKFSDISERWYGRDEAAYVAWATALGGMGVSESEAERAIDDWIWGRQHGRAERLAEELRWAERDIPGFSAADAEAYLELAERLADPTGRSAALKVALRTVFEAGDPGGFRRFILRRGKLWLWSDDIGGDDERRLVESVRGEFGTDKPPFDQKFPVDSKWSVRDLFEPSTLFGPPSDEDLTRFRQFASDTIYGSVNGGKVRAKTVGGLPIHADHPELKKLLRHLGAEAEGGPQSPGMWFHGFTATPERVAGVAKFGLRPGEAAGESNWPRNVEYDRSLVYLTMDEASAKGHACGKDREEHPYAVVVAVRESDLDPTRMEADFDAVRGGFRPNRAGLVGYRGRIPAALFAWAKVFRNGYNEATAPLLLTLGPDEFAALAGEYAAWLERTKDDRKALAHERRLGPSWSDREKVRKLLDRIGTDPIAAAKGGDMAVAASLRSAGARVAGEVSRRYRLPKTLYRGTVWPDGEEAFTGLSGAGGEWGAVWLADTESDAEWFAGWRDPDPEDTRVVFRVRADVRPERVLSVDNETWAGKGWLDLTGRGRDEPEAGVDDPDFIDLSGLSDFREIYDLARGRFDAVAIPDNYAGQGGGADIAVLDDSLLLATAAKLSFDGGLTWTGWMPTGDAADAHERRTVPAALTDAGRRVAAAAYSAKLAGNRFGGVTVSLVDAGGTPLYGAVADVYMGPAEDFQGEGIGEYDHFNPNEPIEECGTVAVLHDLEVPERMRGAGLGRILTEEAARWAFAHGAEAVYAHAADAGGGDPEGFYERLGFEAVGRDSSGNPYMRLLPPGPGARSARKSEMRERLEAAVEASGMSGELAVSSSSNGKWLYLQRTPGAAMSKLFTSRIRPSGGRLWLTMLEVPERGVGAGRRFVEKVEEIARAAGITRIEGKALHESAGFWRAVGYEETGVRKHDQADKQPYHMVRKVLASRPRESAFLARLRDAGATPPAETASAAVSAVMSGTLVHNAAGSAGGDAAEKVRSILDSGIDPERWVQPHPGRAWSGHPKAVYLTLSEGEEDNPPPNYVFAKPALSKPLVLWGWRDGAYAWGDALAEATGKSGAALTSLLRRHGYDSVITVREGGEIGEVGEIAYFGRRPLPAYLPPADRTAGLLAAAAETVRRAAVEDVYRGVKEVVTKYKGRGLFARFSDVPKVGIRPSTEHHDPYGVYFYPVDWLVKEGGWGTTYINLPYITVARIRRSGWLNLATLRPDRARQLAEKGGVLEEYEARTEGRGLNKAKGGRAGKRLWDAVEAKVKPFESDANKMEWNRIFGRMGVKAVYDPGTGSVNAREPSQIVVLDLSLIEVVDIIENREDRKSVFHAVLKAVADGVLDGGWRVSGSHAEGGITASGAVGGKPVALSVMPAKGGFEVEVTLSYHDPAGRKRRITSRGRMPNEWEDAPAGYLAEMHAKTIKKALEDAELGQAGAPDATDELDRALRAMTRLRLPDIRVEDAGDGSVRFWKNMGDGKVEGSLRINGIRRHFEMYAELWLFFSREMPEDAAASAHSRVDHSDTWVIEVGPMRVSWDGDDPSPAAGDMAAEAERALRDVRVTDEKDAPRPDANLEQAGEIARQRVLAPILAQGMVDKAGVGKAASGVSYWHGSSGENIRKMAAEGYVNPGVPEGGPSRRYQAPMAGRTYATKDLGYALMYAINAAMVGQELPAGSPRFDGDGGIALLEPEGDGKPLPDEDWVGKVLTDGEEWRRRSKGDPNASAAEPPEWNIRLYDSLRRRLPPQVVSRLDRKPTTKLYEMATQSMFGKAVNRWLLRSSGPLADELTQRSPHHSFPGRMRVVRAWVFDKREVNPKLKPDGSNFMEMATEIPVARQKAASAPSTKVPFTKLPHAVQGDITDNLHDAFFADTDVSAETLLEVLTEMDTHLTAARLPVAGLADQVRATRGAYSASDVAVSGLMGVLDMGELADLDPILVDGDSFFDGGHRVMAYEYKGRDTIPTVDVSPLLAADWEAEFREEIPGLERAAPRRASAGKEFWQMTRREFMHPKFDVRALDRIANGREGEAVGTLGDYFRGENLRALYASVLDTPIMVINGPIEGGKRVKVPEGHEFKGAFGTFRGKPTIFLPSGTINGLVRALLEEGAHAMRESKGRESPKTSMTGFDWDAYEALPHEQSAAAMSEHALSLGEKDHREFVEEALAAGKPVPPEVLADYPELAPDAATRAASALARAAAAVGRRPWQMTQAEFVEALNRDSGRKCLPDYKPMGAEYFAHMDGEPKSDIGSVALRDGGALELKRSEKKVPWGRHTRQPDGSERYESAGERPEETVFALVDGKVVGYAGDSFGATEMFVATGQQGRGIGSALYKAYLEEFPHRQCAGGFTAAGEGAARATHRRFVEEAVRGGEPVPPEVLADYPHGFGSLRAAVEFRGDAAALGEMLEYLKLYGLLEGSGSGWVRSKVRPPGRDDASVGNVLAMQRTAEGKSGGTLEGTLLLPPGYPVAAADGLAAGTGWGRRTVAGPPLQKAAARGWYYHGSAPDDILDIAQHGLLARGDREGVSVTTTPGRAVFWARLKAPRDEDRDRIVVFRMPASAVGPLEPEDAAPAEPDKDFTARPPIQPESLQIRHGGEWVPLLDVYGEFLDAPAGIETPPATDGGKSASAPSAPDLHAMRAFLERKWAERGRPEPGQNCVATASFLSKAIPGAAVRGGQPEGHRDLVRDGLATEEEARSGGGYRDSDGYLLPHLWAEADGMIYDLTADQFGGNPTAAMSGDPRYVPSELSAKNRRALLAVDEETDGWMEEWTAARQASAKAAAVFYYHGTTVEALRAIELDGRLRAPVYMADTAAAARGFAEMTCDAAGLPGGMAVVLKVALPKKAEKKLRPDPDFAHGSGNFVLDGDVPLEWVPWYPDPDDIAPLASAISRAARALGEHLGETVPAFRAVGAERAESVIRSGFSGGGVVYYTTDWGRACFYARFMSRSRWGAIFEVEADSSRSQLDVNDMTPEQTDEAFGGVSGAAYDMAAAVRSRMDRRLPDGFDRELEHWLGGQLMSEGYYDAPKHPSAWQLVAESGKMTLAEARAALPPGRYGDFVTIDSRGAAGVDADRLPGATQALTGNVPADRIAAAWLPTALLEAAGDDPPAGAAREADQVDIIPAQFEPEDELVAEIEKQVRRRVHRHKELAQELEQIDEAAAMSEDEVARYLGGLDERNSVMSGHVYSKLRRGEEVTAEDLEREEAYFRYELPRDRMRAVKAVRKALASSAAAGMAVAAHAMKNPKVFADYPKAEETPQGPLVDFLYHGTTQGALRHIVTEGLKPSAMGQVSLSETEQYAKSYADRKGGPRGIVLRIKGRSGIIPDTRIPEKGDFRSMSTISVDRIEVKMPDGAWVPLNAVDVSIGTPELKPESKEATAIEVRNCGQASALRRAAETMGDPAGWSEESDVDPADFVDEGFVPDESGHEFWGSRGSGLLFVRDHPEEGGQLLAVHRSSSVEEPDTWGTTGGAVPRGETNDFASAVRETREEIGSIPRYRPVRQYVWKAPAPGTFQYTTFILECLDMDWLPDAFNWEAQDARWVTLDKAASLDLHFGLADLLNKLGESVFPKCRS